jgi:hypothetical protein
VLRYRLASFSPLGRLTTDVGERAVNRNQADGRAMTAAPAIRLQIPRESEGHPDRATTAGAGAHAAERAWPVPAPARDDSANPDAAVGSATGLAVENPFEVTVRPMEIGKVYSGSGYVTSQLSVLVAQFTRVRGDLLVTASDRSLRDDPRRLAQAALVNSLLKEAKSGLEAKSPRLPVVANSLSTAETYLIGLYPQVILRDRCALVRAQLEALRPPPRAILQRLDELSFRSSPRSTSSHARRSSASVDSDEVLRVRQVLTDALNYVHQDAETRLVEDDLQVSRLKKVRWYLVTALVLLLVAVPFGVPADADGGGVVWPVVALHVGRARWLDLVAGALALAALGAVGGILSGMLRVRDSPARLMEYRTSLLLLSLKPLIGAIAAISLYLLLSWETLNGVEVKSPGTYVLMALVAGFSERYFLGFLRRERQGQRACGEDRAAGCR